MRHKCDASDTSLLCASYHPAASYLNGNIRQDTHNTYMERVSAKLCNTTWETVNMYSGQDPWRFIEASFRQLSEELMDKAERS